MTTTTIHTNLNKPLVAVLGFLAGLIVLGVLVNANLALGISDRQAFFALALVGFTMCALGPLGRIAITGYLNPLNITGYLVGAVALLIIAGVAFHLPLPWIATERSALLLLTAVMLVKAGVTALYPRRS